MANVGDDPVRLGLVASLARPGEATLRVSPTSAADLAGKRLELLKEVVPKADLDIDSLGFGNPAAGTQFRETQAGGPGAGAKIRVAQRY